MGARGSSASGPRARWAALLGLSVALHAALLGAFALRLPALAPYARPEAMDVSLVAPFVRPQLAPASARPEPPETRVVVLPTAPRYVAPPEAPTGRAGDAVDVFGPVFADGMWPRPVLVKSEPCPPETDDDPLEACRRDLMMVGVAAADQGRP